jgi:hypothetical protein
MMHQSFDDQPPFRAVSIHPSALVLKNYRLLSDIRAFLAPPVGFRPGLMPKHYSPPASPELDSAHVSKPAART